MYSARDIKMMARGNGCKKQEGEILLIKGMK